MGRKRAAKTLEVGIGMAAINSEIRVNLTQKVILGETLGINEGDMPIFGGRAEARKRASHGHVEG